MTPILRYRFLLALAVLGVCTSILASLIWVYVLYSSELPPFESKVTALLIAMLALTGTFLVMARFARRRLMAIGSTSRNT